MSEPALARTAAAGDLLEPPLVSEENRRYSHGKYFHSQYTLYNARIGFILGERELLVVLWKRQINVFQICDISI